MPGAAKDALRRSDAILNLNHNDDILLAKMSSGTLRLMEKDDGVHMEADPMSSRADINESLERGDISTMSFRFRVKRDEWTYNMDDELDERIIHEIDQIYDVCLVTTGEAYSDTSVALRRRDEWRRLQDENRDSTDKEQGNDGDEEAINLLPLRRRKLNHMALAH